MWTRLYKELVPALKAMSYSWILRLLRQAKQDATSGVIENAPEFPEEFMESLSRTLREAYAYGYWLNHLYIQELKAARAGNTYRGVVKLSEVPGDEELRKILRKFIELEASEDWDAVIPQDALEWLESYTPKLSGGLSDAVLSGVNEVIRGSMREGTTLKERMTALRESSAELSKMSDARLETIARTEITRADTMGRLVSMTRNPDVIGVEFSAIMDDRTTEMCSERHGLVMTLDDPRLPENTPPIHPRCRSMLLSCTIYDYPDGLQTSHEFNEVHAGIQRSEDIEEVRKILNPRDDDEPPAGEPPQAGSSRVPEQTEPVKVKAEVPAVITPSKVYEALTSFYERSLELARNYEAMSASDKLIVQEDMKRLLVEMLGGIVAPEVMEIVGMLLGE